jgi:hypothetical protein
MRWGDDFGVNERTALSEDPLLEVDPTHSGLTDTSQADPGCVKTGPLHLIRTV